jgi:dolichyl-phosphate beta-glucosyltransferase
VILIMVRRMALVSLFLHQLRLTRGLSFTLRHHQEERANQKLFGSTRTDHPHRQRVETTTNLWLSQFPTTPPASQLSSLVVLIPAYNEELRIPATLVSYVNYFENSDLPCQFEILVVDDGSHDGTADVVRRFPQQRSNTTIPIRCISMGKNQGKGAALVRGVQEVAAAAARGDGVLEQNTLILTMDADGSGDLVYLPIMIEALQWLLNESTYDHGLKSQQQQRQPLALVTGNRNYNLWSTRGILRWGFQTCVRVLMMGDNLRVQDTQCGYKLMTLSTANLLFRDLNLRGWSHDVEVLLRAKLCNVPIQDVPIEWEDKVGSQVVADGVARVSIKMLLDVLRLRWEYSVTGNWRP